MDERRIQFRVGVLVLGILVMVVLLIMLFGELPSLVRNQQTLYINFPEAPGVNVDSPVRKSGILIGRVKDVKLLDQSGVLVTTWIDQKYQLHRNEVCRINKSVILGDATLEFVQSGERLGAEEFYQNNDYLQGIVSHDPLNTFDTVQDALNVFVNLEGQMRQSLVTIQEAGQSVGSVAQSLNSVVDNNKDQLQRILQKSEVAMDRMDFAMSTMGQLLGDEKMRAKLQEAIGEIPNVLINAGEVMLSLKGVAERAEQNLENLEGLTEPLGAHGEHFAAALQESIERFQVLMGEMVNFSQSLNDGDGTLGMLINDRELYDRVRRTAENIEYLTRRLRPIVEDARIFTDKIARDPGRIGVKGVFDRSQSGSKF